MPEAVVMPDPKVRERENHDKALEINALLTSGEGGDVYRAVFRLLQEQSEMEIRLLERIQQLQNSVVELLRAKGAGE